jgi:hypothetical protein
VTYIAFVLFLKRRGILGREWQEELRTQVHKCQSKKRGKKIQGKFRRLKKARICWIWFLRLSVPFLISFSEVSSSMHTRNCVLSHYSQEDFLSYCEFF